MRKVLHSMGIPISIDIPDCNDKLVFDMCQQRFDDIDKRFSAYKPNSELSKYRSGKIAKDKLSKEQKLVMDKCQEMEQFTGGYFSANYDGSYDPTGYVKGWAIAEVGKDIEASGFDTYMINAGGDILAHSHSREWTIGIQNPTKKDAILATMSAQSFGVATSGTYERGEHILDPHTKTPATEIVSATVVGHDIIFADVLATALCAMGVKQAVMFITDIPHYDAILIDADGHVISTSDQ